MSFGNDRNSYHDVRRDDYSDDDDDFVEASHRRQQMQLEQQDEGLEMLSQSAERLGKMSMTISDELGQQNKMLDEMDEDLEIAGDHLSSITDKTKEFIEKSGGTKTFLVIICLTVVVIVLFFLILYT